MESLSSCPCREPSVQEQPLGATEVLLFHPATGQVGILNQTAYVVWQLCDGRRGRQAIADALAARFAVAAGRDVAADVDVVLGTLAGRGFLLPPEANDRR